MSWKFTCQIVYVQRFTGYFKNRYKEALDIKE